MAATLCSKSPKKSTMTTWCASTVVRSLSFLMRPSSGVSKRSPRSTASSWSITPWCSTCGHKVPARRANRKFLLPGIETAPTGPFAFLSEILSYLLVGGAVLTGLQHLPCMGQSAVGQGNAAEHTRQFADPPGLVEQRHAGQGGVAFGLLLNVQVLMRLGRDLGQVGDGHDLAVLAQPTEQLTDDLGGGTGNPHIDLIEYQAGNGGVSRCDYLNGQADA